MTLILNREILLKTLNIKKIFSKDLAMLFRQLLSSYKESPII